MSTSFFDRIPSLLWYLALALVGTAGMVLLASKMLPSLPLPPVFHIPQAATGQIGGVHRVSGKQALTIALPAEVDAAKAAKSLILPQGMTGSVQTRDQDLVFVPNSALASGSTLTFTLSREAVRKNGAPYGKEIRTTFVIAGDPSVRQRIPAPDSEEVPVDAQISVIFDRPMVALGTFRTNTLSAENSPALTPAAAGRWRWISTTALAFEPSEPLRPGTTYQVTLPATLASLEGDNVQGPLQWQFMTVRPLLTESDPSSGFMLAGPPTVPSLTFNLPVDLTSAQQHIRLQDAGGTNVAAVIAYGKDEKGKEDAMRLELKPNQPLALNSAYQIVIGTGLLARGGQLGPKEETRISFNTVGPLRATNHTTYFSNFEVEFSSPITAESAQKALVISPAIDTGSLSLSVNDWNDSRNLSVYGNFKAGTTYTVTFGTSLKDTFGQTLQEPYVFTYETPDLEPRVWVESQGEFGMFELDKAPVYRARAVNVSKLQVDVFRLTVPQFLNWRASRTARPSLTDLKGIGSFDLPLPPEAEHDNETYLMEIDFTKQLKQELPAGIYLLQVQAPEYKEWNSQNPEIVSQVFSLTNTALTLKYSGEEALVWATNVQTGAPVANAEVSVSAINGETVLSGKTDADGLFKGSLSQAKFMSSAWDTWSPEFWVTLTAPGDFAFVGSNWRNGLDPYMFGYGEDFWPADTTGQRCSGFVTTDRPLYRAGDTVHFSAIMRVRKQNGSLQLPAGNTFNAVMNDAEGKEIFRETLRPNAYGVVSAAVPLEANASLGSYSLSLDCLPDAQFDSGQGSAYHSFDVRAYRKPEYFVEVTYPEEQPVFIGESVQAQVSGQYAFGAPLAGSKVHWRATKSDLYFSSDAVQGWYSYGTEAVWCDPNGPSCDSGTDMVAEGTGTLDADGLLKVDLPLDSLKKERVSQAVTLEADITDEAGQVVSNRTEIPVHMANVYVGIRSDEYVVAGGAEAPVSLVTTDTNGLPKGGQSVSLAVYERTWNVIKKQGVDKQYYYESTPTDKLLGSKRVTTNDEGKLSTTVTVGEGGMYYVVAEAKDGSGRSHKADTTVYAWSNTYINWPRGNTQRLELVNDSLEYKPGDTASILIKSPFQGEGVKALVTVEHENILSQRIIDVTSSAQRIEVPVTEDMVPAAYVSVVLLKPRQGETFDDQGKDTGVPAFRMGMTRLPVDTSSKVLQVELKPSAASYRPGSKASVQVLLKDATGAPVTGNVSLAVVDATVLSLLGGSTPDPASSFYTDWGLGVRTAQSLLYLIERYKPGSKGGGGGAADSPRGNFRDTAFWQADIVTDAAGMATVEFVWPDNLTTWKFIAVAADKTQKFGAGTAEATVNKPVMVRSVRPRFAVQGDSIMLGAIVHNTLNDSQVFTVGFQGKGVTAKGEVSQSVRIAAGDQKLVTFPVTVDTGTSATLTFTAAAGTATDGVVETIPVYVFGTPQTTATSGIAFAGETQERISIPDVSEAIHPEVTATFAATMGVYLPGGLAYLADFPYGCAEQTLSRFLPSLAIGRLQQLKAFAVTDEARLKNIVTTGVERLYGFQRSDGGFGYWQESPRSYPQVSAYIYAGLVEAKAAGYAVDAGVLERARQYLNDALRVQTGADALSSAVRSTILLAFAQAGHGDKAAMNALLQEKQLPLIAKAQLALAYAEMADSASQKEAEKLVSDLLNSAVIDSRGAHFSEEQPMLYRSIMQTEGSLTAIATRALLRTNPQSPVLPELLRYLLSIRENGHWDSTQSTVQSLFAFTEYVEATGELNADFFADITLNDAQTQPVNFSEKNILHKETVTFDGKALQVGQSNTLRMSMTGTGRLYYDVLLSAFTVGDTLPEIEAGIGIDRTMEPLFNSPVSPAVGGTYRVTLTLTVPEDRHFVAVESPLPAGMEPIDTDFKTSQQQLLSGSTDETSDQENGDSWWWYWSNPFTHTEIRDDRIFLFAEDLPAGVYTYQYLMRGSVPGTYKVRPARAWEMYFPEVFGQTTGETMNIREMQ